MIANTTIERNHDMAKRKKITKQCSAAELQKLSPEMKITFRKNAKEERRWSDQERVLADVQMKVLFIAITHDKIIEIIKVKMKLGGLVKTLVMHIAEKEQMKSKSE